MKIREAYKGHVIEAMSFELRDNPGFVSQLFIEEHDGEGVTVTQFFVAGVFVSDEAALLATVLAGRRKIDSGYRPTVKVTRGDGPDSPYKTSRIQPSISAFFRSRQGRKLQPSNA